MRILQLVNSLQFGGAESLLHDLALQWKRSGLEVDIAVLCRTASALETSLEAAGVRVIHTGVNKIYDPQQVPAIAKLFAEYGLVHVHLFPAQLWAGMAWRFCSNKPRLITTEHSTVNRRRNKRLYHPVDCWMYNNYELIACISDAAADAMRAWVPEVSPKLRIVLNGIDATRLSNAPAARKEDIIGCNVPVVLMVGRFEFQKNQPCAIGALTRVPHAHLVLVGDGPLRPRAEQLARALGLQDRVHFLGRRRDVPELLKMADVYVQPSRFEGFGLAALEAMAAGIPVVASDVPGLASIVRGAGILVPPGEAELLAAEINALLGSPERKAELSQAGLRRALEYTVERTANQYAELYNSLSAGGVR